MDLAPPFQEVFFVSQDPVIGLSSQEIEEICAQALSSLNDELRRQYWDSPPVPNASEEGNKILKTTVVFNTRIANMVTTLIEANNRKIMEDLRRLGVLRGQPG